MVKVPAFIAVLKAFRPLKAIIQAFNLLNTPLVLVFITIIRCMPWQVKSIGGVPCPLTSSYLVKLIR